MSNAEQPEVTVGAKGPVVRRLQRALRRTPNLGIVVDGDFGSGTLAAVREFQAGAGLQVDGVVGPGTWAALPDGGQMPLLSQGCTGDVVKSLQQVLVTGAGQWNSPGSVDGVLGPATRISVESFQRWAQVAVDGVVGERTWDVSLHAAGATLETTVGLQFIVS
jgi:peptidoglycan hydrolase-like protein with peptidoglycan-binding domain